MILGVFGNPKSWLFWEMIGVTGALAASLIYLICLYREADQTRTRAFSLISALFSLIAVFALGANMVMSWRPVLNSYTLMLPFIGLYWSAASLCFLVEREFEDAEKAKGKNIFCGRSLRYRSWLCGIYGVPSFGSGNVGRGSRNSFRQSESEFLDRVRSLRCCASAGGRLYEKSKDALDSCRVGRDFYRRICMAEFAIGHRPGRVAFLQTLIHRVGASAPTRF